VRRLKTHRIPYRNIDVANTKCLAVRIALRHDSAGSFWSPVPKTLSPFSPTTGAGAFAIDGVANDLKSELYDAVMNRKRISIRRLALRNRSDRQPDTEAKTVPGL
jgi:hypothetical protein